MKVFGFFRESFLHYLGYFPIILLFGVFWVLVFRDINLRKEIASLQMVSDPLPGFLVSLYPVVAGDFPVISAQAAVVMDGDSDVLVYAKNPNVVFSPASTTKMMTALVGLDYFKPA